MPTVEEFVAGAYLLPSDEGLASFSLHRAGIESMWSILRDAANREGEDHEIGTICRLMEQHLCSAQRDHWLSSPLLAESLHAISANNSQLQAWHACVATPSINDVAPPPAADDAGFLGVFLLPLVLKDNREECGRFTLRTDLLGRIVFPGTDWRIDFAVQESGSTSREAPSRELILLYLDPLNACFYREDGEQLCLTIPRTCLSGIAFQTPSDSGLKATLTRSPRFQGTSVRFDAAHFASGAEQAPLVGGVIEQILVAIQECSPQLFSEFLCYIHSVRGYELPASDGNLISSFSDPTQPGIMNLNVTFAEGEPCLSPFCFTWFAHELAHTKNYLIDTVAFRHGMSFVLNRAQLTPRISRYGRSFPIRTLVQIPYVHMYEWDLLMDAYESGIHLLPWVNTEDAVELVADLRGEIADGFEFISRYADLTELGQAALAHQEELYRRCKRRWSRLRQVR